jgi:hypothetical protein
LLAATDEGDGRFAGLSHDIMLVCWGFFAFSPGAGLGAFISVFLRQGDRDGREIVENAPWQ